MKSFATKVNNQSDGESWTFASRILNLYVYRGPGDPSAKEIPAGSICSLLFIF